MGLFPWKPPKKISRLRRDTNFGSRLGPPPQAKSEMTPLEPLKKNLGHGPPRARGLNFTLSFKHPPPLHGASSPNFFTGI